MAIDFNPKGLFLRPYGSKRQSRVRLFSDAKVQVPSLLLLLLVEKPVVSVASVTLSVTPFHPVSQQVKPRRDRLTDKNTKNSM